MSLWTMLIPTMPWKGFLLGLKNVLRKFASEPWEDDHRLRVWWRSGSDQTTFDGRSGREL